MTTIQDRIEHGRQIVEHEALEQEKEAQKYRDRVARAWDAAIADMLECIPEELREFASTRNPQAGTPPQSPMTLRLSIPRLAPILVYYRTKYMDKNGYEGFQWVVDGLEKNPYRVAEYYAGWYGDMEKRIVEERWDRTRVDYLDVALFIAAEEEANLPSVSDHVNELNAKLEEKEAVKKAKQRTPETRIADQLALLFNMVQEYTEPEPY